MTILITDSYKFETDPYQLTLHQWLEEKLDGEYQARKMLQAIADNLREKGAGHLADLLNTTDTDVLTAIAEEVESGGHQEEAAEIRIVASELSQPL